MWGSGPVTQKPPKVKLAKTTKTTTNQANAAKSSSRPPGQARASQLESACQDPPGSQLGQASARQRAGQNNENNENNEKSSKNNEKV